MIRMIHCADLHLGLLSLGVEIGGRNSRSIDAERALTRLVDHAIEQEASLIVLAGDVFHGKRPAASDILLFIRMVKRATAAGIRVAYGPGNHDSSQTLTDVAAKTSGWLAETDIPLLHSYPTPAKDLLHLKGGDLQITSLPYPHKRALDAQLQDVPPEDRTEAVSKRVNDMIMLLAEEAQAAASSIPRLFLGHLSVAGSMAGSETMMQIGMDVTVSAHVFEGFTYAALGHLHPQQRVADRVWYAGSAQPVTFGEVGQTKGFLVVTFEDDGAVTVKPVDSASRPIMQISLTGEEESPAVVVAPIPEGAIVRVVFDQTSTGYEDAVMREVARVASYSDSHRVAKPRARRDSTVSPLVMAQEGIPAKTRAWLAANNLPEQPYMDAALELIQGDASAE